MARPEKFRDKWRIRWTDADGVRHSELYDKYDDADFMLAKHNIEAKEVKRSLRVPIAPNKTFEDICTYWLKNRAVQKRDGGKDDESIIRCHLKPNFSKYKLSEIGPRQADEFVLARAHLDKKTVFNHLTLLISMLNAAVDITWLSQSPRIKKPRVKLLSKDFKFLRTYEEIQRLLMAAQVEGEMIFSLFAFAIYTGARAGEAAGLLKDDIDFPNRQITIQRSFRGPTKSDEVRHVPIFDPLLPILRRWVLYSSSKLVFFNSAGNMLHKSDRAFQEVLHRVLVRAGFPKIERKGKTRHYISFHDFRHTFASHWMMSGGDIYKLKDMLGHKSVTMTERYSHLAPQAFAGDYGRLGTTSIIETAKVFSIAKD